MRSCVSSLLKISNIIYKNKTNIRLYARWAHRHPIRVIKPEDYYPEENTILKNSKNIIQPQNLDDKVIELDSFVGQNEKQYTNKNLIDVETLDKKTHFKPEKVENKKSKIKYTENEVLDTTFDESGNYVYTKMKNNDPKIGSLIVTVKSRKMRKKKECILLEGKRLIRDALLAKCIPQHILFSRKQDLDYIKDLLPQKDVKLYKLAYRDIQMWSDLTTSPGIMGIFKAPKVDEIVFVKNQSFPLTIICDNIREPGNLGAILRSSVAAGAQQIFLTKGCVDMWETKVLRSSSGAHFRLPIHKYLDWTQIYNQIPKGSSIFLADNNIISTPTKTNDSLKELCLNVPVLPYYSVNFSNYPSIVLIIGGETLGLSEESYKLALESGGCRLNIPLNNDIESLNTGIALGILAFEIKRQLLLKI